MNRHTIDLAVQRIELQWRAGPSIRLLITELTALDWQVRTLDNNQPLDENLIGRIGRLRSQIWLASRT